MADLIRTHCGMPSLLARLALHRIHRIYGAGIASDGLKLSVHTDSILAKVTDLKPSR